MDKTQLGAAGAGAAAGALLWKKHRIWGALLGAALGYGGYSFYESALSTVRKATDKATQMPPGVEV